MPPPPPPSRTNAELNLIVLRRHNPAVSGILSIAPYAVVYLFSPTAQQWEKCGVEGTLFVCQLTPSPIGAERYAVTILNRRGLNNFTTELLNGDDVEITEEYVILQVTGGDGTPQVFGLWIFSEPPPSSTSNAREMNAQIIQACAAQAEASRRVAEAQQQQLRMEQHQHPPAELQHANRESPSVELENDAQGAAMGRQLSLRQLFGQQREQDSGWSVHMHGSPASQPSQPQPQPQPQPQSMSAPEPARFVTTADTEFFRSTQRHAPSPHRPDKQPTAELARRQGQGEDLLGALFRKAKEAHQLNA